MFFLFKFVLISLVFTPHSEITEVFNYFYCFFFALFVIDIHQIFSSNTSYCVKISPKRTHLVSQVCLFVRDFHLAVAQFFVKSVTRERDNIYLHRKTKGTSSGFAWVTSILLNYKDKDAIQRQRHVLQGFHLTNHKLRTGP